MMSVSNQWRRPMMSSMNSAFGRGAFVTAAWGPRFDIKYQSSYQRIDISYQRIDMKTGLMQSAQTNETLLYTNASTLNAFVTAACFGFLQTTLDVVYICVGPWSKFPIVPFYHHFPQPGPPASTI
jgi:hypothetical protein